MKGQIIFDAVESNPLAEFACKPDRTDTKVVRVRGLKYVIGGSWSVAESTDPFTGAWRKNEETWRMTSRELTTVEDAEMQVRITQAKNAERCAEQRKVDVVVGQLVKHGVACVRMNKRIVVDDVAQLGRLLAKVPT
jgi:hypothetical protein